MGSQSCRIVGHVNDLAIMILLGLTEATVTIRCVTEKKYGTWAMTSGVPSELH